MKREFLAAVIVILFAGNLCANVARNSVAASVSSNLSSLSSDEHSLGVSIAVNTNEGFACYPVVATDGEGGIYVVWLNHIFQGEYDVYTQVFFACSHDYGKGWSNEIIINDNSSIPVSCSTPSIAIDKQNDYVYVAWEDNRTGRTNIYVDKSVNHGMSFGPDVKINDNDGMAINPYGLKTVHIAVGDDGKVYVVWEDNRLSADPNPNRSDIFLASSTDNGGTFGSNVMVNPPDSSSKCRFPWIAVNNAGVVYVAYTKQTYPLQDVCVARSFVGGGYLQTPVKVNDDSTGGYRGKKEITFSKSGKICVVWTDGRAGSGGKYWDIYFATSSDGGLSFSPNVRVNDDPLSPVGQNTAQGTASLAVDSHESVHIVWEDFRNYNVTPTHRRDIYHSYSKDGMTFSKNVQVNYLPDATEWNCADPSMVIDSEDNLYTVWSDTPYGGDNMYIYFDLLPGRTIIVPDDYPTIQQAVGAASNGDTVFVRAGEYLEEVQIWKKTISLIGENANNTVIRNKNNSTQCSTGVVWMYEATGVLIKGFTITPSLTNGSRNAGIVVGWLCTNCTITDCVIEGFNATESCCPAGIDMEGTGCKIFRNVLRYNFHAISTESSLENGDHQIYKNVITDNDFGVYGYTPDKLMCNFKAVWGNNITENGYGIAVLNSTNNIIYHNNFINNTWSYQPTYGEVQIWDNGYPSGGNYWDKYVGVDADHDCLGDTSYNVYSNNKDNYPLIGPFHTFSAGTWNETQFDTDIVSKSGIAGFDFNPDSKTLNFVVMGRDDTTGFCRVTIPKDIMWCDNLGEWTITVGGTLIAPTNVTQTIKYTYISFVYTHSTKVVEIKSTNAVPEFAVVPILLMLVMATTLVAVVTNRKHTLRATNRSYSAHRRRN